MMLRYFGVDTLNVIKRGVLAICTHGTHKLVYVINQNQNRKQVVVDACIADEIQDLNNKGVITLGCCCGHGKAGKVIEYSNGFDKWKEHGEPPHVLIDEASVSLTKGLGYRPYPYYYADGEYHGVWQMHLKTGCMTEDECTDWAH
jgi:hypothetical protein